MVVDAAFFSANLAKVADGGYVPLLLASLVYGLMWIWHRGARSGVGAAARSGVPSPTSWPRLEPRMPRVPGTAVFLTRTEREAPPVMVWHCRHNRALHRTLFVLTVATEPVPWIAEADRLTIEQVAPSFWRAIADFGFMERPDIPPCCARPHSDGCNLDLPT